MDEGRLEEIKARIESMYTANYYDTNDFANALSDTRLEAQELIEEVESLRGRLEAVCGVVSDAAAFGDDISALRVMEAVRGAGPYLPAPYAEHEGEAGVLR